MGELVTRKSYSLIAMTWNVNEQRPENSAAFTELRVRAAERESASGGGRHQHQQHSLARLAASSAAYSLLHATSRSSHDLSR